jgi:hypothetical protein
LYYISGTVLAIKQGTCKIGDERAYTVPRSICNNAKIVSLVDIGVLEEVNSSEWAPPSFPRKTENQ